MHCHDNKNSDHKSQDLLKHAIHMVICCAAPIIIIAVIPFLKLNTGLRTTILNISPFICPVMMIFMIPMMLKGMGTVESNKDTNKDTNKGKVSMIDEKEDKNILTFNPPKNITIKKQL